jgi:adenine-specific DNA-methyltransferase
MQRAFETIKQLVADFKAQESAYLSPSYQESQIRQDFIDKFFTALGWDVTHTIQKNPYEQEVKIENKVSTQGSQRRADYAFFIAPNFRDVKFYAEAKKPAKNLKDAAFYHQTIRYGWNSSTPLAILTDFEEFHILDCRYKPDVDDALNRKLEYFHYSEYADEEKFKKIFYLFGREAVANGSLEKYAATLTKPRGKAIQRGLFKGGYQPVDEAFLEELDSYREALAKAFKKENPGLGSEELTEAVQRTIDRLVFIRFLEDKQIEDPQIINYSEAGTAWKKFSAHCRTLEPKYNGLVFKKHRILDDSKFVPPDDNTFADICNELADPSSPYDFDKIPISILGSIYERFLGKVVHATAKQVRVELKPEVRKAGGVYYTPQYIVRYIVKETIGKLLYEEGEKQSPLLIGEGQGEVSKAKLILEPPVVPLKRGQLVHRDRNDGFRKSPEEVAMMSFADIACGSGSFLIEVYSVLLEYHERYYAAHPEAAKKGDLSTRDGKQVLSLKKRQEILISNIYGVDIDFQATEVTQLSLYLKLLEEATLNDAVQFSLLKEKLLPDLRNNIICGNSLIGTDINAGELFESKDTDNLKPMNFEDAFPAVMNRGGFDAVVGNPPYALIGSDRSIEYKYYNSGCYELTSYKTNTYLLFVERGLKLLKKSLGKLGLIIPKSLVFNTYYENARKKLLSTYAIKSIIEIREKVFANAEVGDSILFFADRQKEINSNQLQYVTVANIWPKYDILESHSTSQRDLLIQDDGKLFVSGIELRVLTIPLCNKCDVSNGLNPGNIRHLLLANKKKNSKHKPMLLGRDIQIYKLNWSGTWVNYDINLRNTIKLSDTKSKAGMIAQSKVDFALRNPNIYNSPKILIRKTADRLIAAFDSEGFYYDSLSYGIQLLKDTSESIYYFLGLLNSSLMGFLHDELSQNKDKVFAKVLAENLKKLPIRTIDFTNETEKAKHDGIVNLVDQMLKAKEELAAAKLDQDVQRLEHRCATLDRQIDEAVYELYGLTEEEIKIVEGKK